MTSIREQVEAGVKEQVAAAFVKGHKHNFQTLYVDSDGEVFWNEEADSNTWLQNEDGTLTSIYRIGCGGFSCNCDACQAGEDLTAQIIHYEDICELEDLLAGKVEELPKGFFADEA